MLDKLYFKSNHLTPIAYVMLESEVLSTDERQLMLAHISGCDSCMESYLASLTEDSLIEPNEGLTDTIMQNIGQIKEEIKEKSRKTIFMQFAKLSVAVCLMMGIFFSGALGFKVNDMPNQRAEDQKSQAATPPQKIQTKPEIKNPTKGFFDGLYDSFNRGFTGFADQINLGYKGDALDGAK